MGQFVPFLATLGGGSALLGGLIGGTAIASAGLSAYQAHEAGVAQQRAYKTQAKQAADAAREREINRRRDLMRALASQNAMAGAGGVSTRAGTGVAMTAQYDIDQAKRDVLIDRVNTGRERNLLISAGRNARKMGDLGAARSLLDLGTDLAKASVR